MDIEAKLKQLEMQIINLQNSFIQSQKNQVPIITKTYDAYNRGSQIDTNTSNIKENDSAICDIAELSDVNSMAIDDLAEMADTNSLAIDDLAEMIDDLEQRVEALEGKNNEE